MLGALIGDIAGSFREFSKNKYPELKLIPSQKEMFGKHRYGITDDSVLTLATAFTLLRHRNSLDNIKSEDFAVIYHSFGNIYNEPIGGYGGGFLNWISEPISTAKPYNSCGNGSAMRVSPVGYIANSIEEVIELAFKSAVCTHNHPEGIKGAQATASMIFLARKGWKLNDIVDYLRKSYLSYTPIEQFGHFDSICQETMCLVMHCLLTTDNFYDAVFKAVTIPNADSDTVGAIVGSIAEPLYGIPEDLRKQAMSFIMDKDLLAVFNDFSASFVNNK